MADNQIVKIEFDFDLGNVPASVKKFNQYLQDVDLNLKVTKKSAKQLGDQVAQTGKQLGDAGNSIKKGNQQWMNLALVVQDLPFGFRGIQNNLPALVGGIAGVSGAFYFAASAAIALFTAWDMGAFGATKSTNNWAKALKETNDEIRNTLNYTNSEVSNLQGLVDVMLDVNTTESLRKKALQEAVDAISKVDEAEGKKIKTYGDAIVAIGLYTEAIQQQQMQEVIGKKIAEITIGQIEKRNKLSIETAKASKGIHPIDFFMGNTELSNLKSEIISNETLLRQLEDLRKGNTKALLLNPFSKYNAKSEVKEKKGKTTEQLAKEKQDAIDAANNAETKAFINTLDERAQKEYKAGLELIDGLEKMKAAGFSDSITYYSAYRQTMLNIAKQYDDKEAKIAKDNADKIAKIQLDNRYDIANAILKINEEFAKKDIENVNAQLSSTLKATKGNYQGQKDAINAAITKLTEYRDAAKEAGYGTVQFDDAIKKLGFSLEGLVDPIENFNAQLSSIINSTLADLAGSLGESIANSLLGTGGLKDALNGFLSILASGLIQVGELAVATGFAILGIKKALETLNPYVAIAAGIALIALGSFVRGSLSKKSEKMGSGTAKFANGGIVSGPTMGLMGEYPGAQNNPEVIAPLDKLKGLMGGGGTLEARISGNDLLVLVNRAQRNNNQSF